MLRRLLLISIGLLALGLAFVAGVATHKYRGAIRARLSALQGSGVIQTNLYNLSVQKLAVPGEGRDGSIDTLDNGILFFNRRGDAWFVTPERALQPLSISSVASAGA